MYLSKNTNIETEMCKLPRGAYSKYFIMSTAFLNSLERKNLISQARTFDARASPKKNSCASKRERIASITYPTFNTTKTTGQHNNSTSNNNNSNNNMRTLLEEIKSLNLSGPSN